ncbi:MAG: hypothetical protein GY939_11405 [Actinomycetia bacterium]|nr:hypothetical protein [Actinomycetes bacterium]
MDYRQWIGASGVMAGLVVVVINYTQGDVVFATILLVLVGLLFGLLVWWTRPSRGGPHISHAAAQAAAGDGDVILYWRPGCIYCDRLKLGLGSARHDVSWVNILKDSEAAEFVTTYRDGNETVPTAVTGAGEMIDATPAAIKAQLGAAS